MARYRINNQLKKSLKQIENAFAAAGFEPGEAKALTKAYYTAICNKHSRLDALKRLDEPDDVVETDQLEDIE